MGCTGYGPNWSWPEIVFFQNDPKPGDMGACFLLYKGHIIQTLVRTSDGGNGNHSVLLPIILIKIKVDKMLPSSYISSLLVSIL